MLSPADAESIRYLNGFRQWEGLLIPRFGCASRLRVACVRAEQKGGRGARRQGREARMPRMCSFHFAV